MTQQITIHGVDIKYSQQPEFWQLVGNGGWELFTFDCIDRLLIPGKVFIDMGAWNGVFSIYASKKDAMVYSIEPDFAAIDLFNTLHYDNEINYNLFKGAISNRSGAAVLNSNANCFGNSESSLINRGVIDGESEVDSRTLSDYLRMCEISPKDICLIKMDVEGSEINILNQARQFIIANKPNMHISFHPAWFPNFDNDIDSILYLFDVYSAVSDKGNSVTSSNFKDVLNNHEHAILFYN